MVSPMPVQHSQIAMSLCWSHDLMQVSIAAVNEHFKEHNITISAQEYLKKFYESHGFVQTSEMYLEDDIPHIQMKKS